MLTFLSQRFRFEPRDRTKAALDRLNDHQLDDIGLRRLRPPTGPARYEFLNL